MEPVRITASSGRIRVQAEVRDDVEVERGQHHPMGGVLEVQGESSGVVMRVPEGTDLVVGSHSGAVELRGELGDVRATTRSGSVTVEACRALDARTVSGRVEVGRVTGDARIKVASGRVVVEHVGGDLAVTAVSGRIDVEDVAGAVRATTVNGRVEIATRGEADVRCESVSGAVVVRVPRNVKPDTHLRSVSGRCACKVTEGDDCTVVGRTISGSITVRAAR